MRIAYGLVFSWAIILHSLELARTVKPQAIHPLPLHFGVQYFEASRPRGFRVQLAEGLYYVKTTIVDGQKYAFGVVMQGKLYPFMAPKSDNPNIYERVKIHIAGDRANGSVTLEEGDPLNRLFYKRVPPEEALFEVVQITNNLTEVNDIFF